MKDTAQKEVPTMYEDKPTLSDEETKTLIAQLTEHDNIESPNADLLKIDSDMGLESLWLVGAGMSFVVAVGFLWSRCEETNVPTSYIVIPVLTTIVFALLYSLTDNHHILDLVQRKILYNHKFLGMGGTKQRATFSDIIGVVVKAGPERTRTSTYWGYKVGLVDRKGKFLSLTDTAYEYEAYNTIAQDLAILLGTDVYPSGEEDTTAINYDNKTMQVSIEQLPEVEATPLSIKRILFVTMGVLMGIATLMIIAYAIGSG